MSTTAIYNLIGVDPYQDTSEVLDTPRKNFQAIENQLSHIYKIFFNGVIDDDSTNPSWHIVRNGTSTTTVLITSGTGHVALKYAETTNSRIVTLTPPTANINPIRYWIYAEPTIDTAWTKDVRFFASFIELTDTDKFVCLGSVIVTTTINGTTIDCKNEASYGRVEISLIASLGKIVNAHKHIGGAKNPSPINLGLHVSGKLSKDNIEDLDASSITSGLFDPDRLPTISHTSLIDIGNLTHAEIESELAVLQSLTDFKLSDYMIANNLQTAIGLKRLYGTLAALYDIDKNLINAFVYFPSDNSTSLEGNGDVPVEGGDPVVALATIDRSAHQIIGEDAVSINTGFITWTTDTDFLDEISRGKSATLSIDPLPENIVVTGTGSSGAITVSRPVSYQAVEKQSLSSWKWGTSLTDKAGLQTISPPSGVTLNHFIENINGANEYQGLRRYFYHRFDDVRSWDNKQLIGFSFSSTGHPGALYFYLILDKGGTSVSVQPPTGTAINLMISTPVEIKNNMEGDITGRYMEIALSSLVSDSSNLSANIRGVGFYYQTATGWDTDVVDISLNVPTPEQIDDDRVNAARTIGVDADLTVTMFVWNNSLYAEAGKMAFRFFANTTQARFNAVVFDCDQPSLLSIKTRAANTEAGLSANNPLPLQPGGIIAGNSSKGAWIDIIVELDSNLARIIVPTLSRLVLSYSSPSLSAYQVWDSDAKWNTGRTFNNITVNSNQLSISADTTNRVGDWTFASGNFISYAEDANNIHSYQNGSSLYKTPRQAFEPGGVIGFKKPKDVINLTDGRVIVADTDNDRVVCLTKSGDFVWGIQGNIRLRRTNRDFAALTAYYNPRLGKLYICFSQNIKINKPEFITLVSGQTTIALNSPGVQAVLHSPLGGKSASIEVTFSQTVKNQIASFSGGLSVLIIGPNNGSAGAVERVATSTDGTPISSIPVTSGGGGGGTGTIPDYLTNPVTLFTVYGVGDLASGVPGATGGFVKTTGIEVPTSTNTDSGDFNGDGNIVTNTLYGPGGQVGTVTIPVFVGEILLDNLFEPISVQYQAESFGNILIGAVGSDAAVCYSATFEKLYTIGTAIAPMRETLGGSAWELQGSDIGLVLMAIPSPVDNLTQNGAVLLLARKQDNKLISKIEVDGDAVRAQSTSNGLLYWVLMDDRAGKGNRSRLIRVNSSGRKDFSFGNATTQNFLHPTGIRILENDTLLISQ